MQRAFTAAITLSLCCQITFAQAAKKKTPATCGPPTSESLSCPRFGFTYKIPFGWVDRTADMGNEPGATPPNSNFQPETLLAIFERPPAAPGETINSAVVIAAEPLANYPQVKKASDYFGPINELAEQRGFKAEGEPYAFTIGARQLVRADFSKPRGNLTMCQTSLAVIDKGYIVSWTFVAGSEDEIDDLIENLRFGGGTRPKPHH